MIIFSLLEVTSLDNSSLFFMFDPSVAYNFLNNFVIIENFGRDKFLMVLEFNLYSVEFLNIRLN